MNNVKNICIAVMTILLVLCIYISPVYAETSSEDKQELIDIIQKMNSKCKFVNSVTKDLAFLISEEEGTTKVMKAKKYKIPVYSINDALKTISKL